MYSITQRHCLLYFNKQKVKLEGPLVTAVAFCTIFTTATLLKFLFCVSSFQTSTDLERNQWIESLTMAIMTGLDLGPPDNGVSKNKDSQV